MYFGIMGVGQAQLLYSLTPFDNAVFYPQQWRSKDRVRSGVLQTCNQGTLDQDYKRRHYLYNRAVAIVNVT